MHDPYRARECDESAAIPARSPGYAETGINHVVSSPSRRRAHRRAPGSLAHGDATTPHPAPRRARSPPWGDAAAAARVGARRVAARLSPPPPRRPPARQSLAFLLWPDSTEAQARTNLRHVLHNLRRALPDPDSLPRGDAAHTAAGGLTRPSGSTSPVRRGGLRGRRGATPTTHSCALRDAVELYTGDLARGALRRVAPRRARAAAPSAISTALARLAALLEARGDCRGDPRPPSGSCATTRSARRPTDLMRLHDARGDRARALHVYHVCAATLEREVGVEPSAGDTRGLRGVAAGRPATDRPGTSRRTRRRAVARRAGGGMVAPDGPLACDRARAGPACPRHRRAGHRQVAPRRRVPRLVPPSRRRCRRGALLSGRGRARLRPGCGLAAYGGGQNSPRAARPSAPDGTRPPPPRTPDGGARPDSTGTAPEAEQRQRLFDAVARAFRAPGAPLLLVADDLHWCDRETLQFLHYLLRADPRPACSWRRRRGARRSTTATH